MWTSSIILKLSQVPKLTSYTSLYNEPLFSGHLYYADVDSFYSYKPLLSRHKTELTNSSIGLHQYI